MIANIGLTIILCNLKTMFWWGLNLLQLVLLFTQVQQYLFIFRRFAVPLFGSQGMLWLCFKFSECWTGRTQPAGLYTRPWQERRPLRFPTYTLLLERRATATPYTDNRSTRFKIEGSLNKGKTAAHTYYNHVKGLEIIQLSVYYFTIDKQGSTVYL